MRQEMDFFNAFRIALFQCLSDACLRQGANVGASRRIIHIDNFIAVSGRQLAGLIHAATGSDQTVQQNNRLRVFIYRY